LGPTSTDFEEPCKKSAPNLGIDPSESGETASGAVHDTRYVSMHGHRRESHVRFFELKRGRTSPNELADREHHAKRRAHFFLWTRDGFERDALCAAPEFTQTRHNNPLLERLSQAMKGRFPGLAPISYMAPQNPSKSDPNYHVRAATTVAGKAIPALDGQATPARVLPGVSRTRSLAIVPPRRRHREKPYLP
jgi:hypothetical protein